MVFEYQNKRIKQLTVSIRILNIPVISTKIITNARMQTGKTADKLRRIEDSNSIGFENKNTLLSKLV